MNHRVIRLTSTDAILLDRLVGDGGEDGSDWQVMISMYLDDEYRFDEWVNFDDPFIAQSFIIDFSERSAIRFIKRARVAYEQILKDRQDRQARLKQMNESNAFRGFWNLVTAAIRRSP